MIIHQAARCFDIRVISLHVKSVKRFRGHVPVTTLPVKLFTVSVCVLSVFHDFVQYRIG